MKNKKNITLAISLAIAVSATTAQASIWSQTVDMSKRAYENVSSFWINKTLDKGVSDNQIPSEKVSVEQALIDKIKNDEKEGISVAPEVHLVDMLEMAIARQDSDDYYSYAKVSEFVFKLIDHKAIELNKYRLDTAKFMHEMHMRGASRGASADFRIELNQIIAHIVSQTEYADLYAGRLSITDSGSLLIQSDKLYKLNRIDLTNGLESYYNMKHNKMGVGPDGFPIQVCRMANNDHAAFIEIAYTDIERLMDVVFLPEDHRGACVTQESLEEIGYAADRVNDFVTPLGHWRL